MTQTLNSILAMHIGKDNAITSSELADKLGIIEDDTHQRTRQAILQCVEEYHLPLVASRKGYYLIEDENDLDAYIKTLDRRIAGIEKRKRLIKSNYRTVLKNS